MVKIDVEKVKKIAIEMPDFISSATQCKAILKVVRENADLVKKICGNILIVQQALGKVRATRHMEKEALYAIRKALWRYYYENKE
jgi:hypothetical protein